MKVFVLMGTGGSDLELIGDYELEQIPAIGEKFITRIDDGLRALLVTEVRHFVTGGTATHGAFVTVDAGEFHDVPAELAEFFAS